MVSRRTTLASVWAGAALLMACATAAAQTFPQGPVKFVVPYAPGGSTDLIARALADHMTKRFGQPVLVINQPGAGGGVGTTAVARSAPDGHTLLMATNGTHAINPTLYAKLPYDAVKDFEPVSLVASVPLVLAVPAKSESRTMREFVERSASNNKVSFGSAGVGSSGHLAGEMLNMGGNLRAVHVAYKGDGPAVIDLMTGSLDYLFANMPAAIGQVRAGTIRALAVTSERRSPALPDVPTATEAGYPRLQLDPWYGVLVASGTDRRVVNALNEAINDALKDPQIRQRLETAGATPQGTTPERFAQIIATDTARFAPVIKASGAKVD